MGNMITHTRTLLPSLSFNYILLIVLCIIYTPFPEAIDWSG